MPIPNRGTVFEWTLSGLGYRVEIRNMFVLSLRVSHRLPVWKEGRQVIDSIVTPL